MMMRTMIPLLFCILPLGVATAQVPVIQPTPTWVIDGAASTLTVPWRLVLTPDQLWIMDPLSGLFQMAPPSIALRELASSGAGPGEYRTLTTIGPEENGGFILWDMSLRRLSQFDSHGDYVDSPPPLEIPPYTARDVRAVARQGESFLMWMMGEPRTNPTQTRLDTLGVVWRVSSSAEVETLIEVPGPDYIVDREPDNTASILAPFGDAPVLAFRPEGGFVLGRSRDRTIKIYDENGRLEGQVTLPFGAPREVTEQDRQNYLSSTRSLLFGELDRANLPADLYDRFAEKSRSMLRSAEAIFPDTWPFYERLLISPTDDLWILISAPQSSDVYRFYIYSLDDSELLHEVRIPRKGRLLGLAVSNSHLVISEETSQLDLPVITGYELSDSRGR